MSTKNGLVLAFSAILALLVVGAVAVAAPQHQHGTAGATSTGNAAMETTAQGKEVALQGEVLDLYCYMLHPETGQGMDHAKCAKTCIQKGLPIGFLSQGNVYLLIGKDHESVKDMVADLAGKQSLLKGTLVSHDGVNAIEVSSVEPVTGTAGSPGK